MSNLTHILSRLFRWVMLPCLLFHLARAQEAPQEAPVKDVAGDAQPRNDSRPQRNGGSVSPLLVQNFEYHRKMRRGRDEEFVVVLCRRFGNLNWCPSFGNNGTLLPVSLHLDAADGFSFHQPGQKEYETELDLAPQRQSGKQATSDQNFFHFKVRSRKDVALGQHKLQGVISFRVINDGRLSDIQTTVVEIPLEVVKHGEVVGEGYWPIPKHNPLAPLGNALEFTLALPFILPFIVACEIDGCH